MVPLALLGLVLGAAGVAVGAYLMVQGLNPERHAWFGWAGLLPLFLAIRVLSPRRAMFCGGLWGACVYLFAAPLPAFTSIIWSATGGTAALPAANVIQPGWLSFVLLAIAPAVYAWLAAHYTRWYTFDPLGLGVGWAGVEFALMPLGLHHGLVGQTVENGLLFDVVGRFLGYVLVALVVAFTSAALVATVARVRLPDARTRSVVVHSSVGRVLSSRHPLRPLYLAFHEISPRAPPSKRDAKRASVAPCA